MLVELVLGPLALLAFLLDVSGSLLVLAHFKKGSQMDEPIEPSLAASGPPLATICWSSTGAGLHGACDWQQNSKNKAPSANTLTMVPPGFGSWHLVPHQKGWCLGQRQLVPPSNVSS